MVAEAPVLPVGYIVSASGICHRNPIGIGAASK